MSDVVAKKYVKALTKSMSDEELSSTLSSLQSIVPAFKDSKFMNILNSYDVLSSQKETLVESMIENPDEKFKNFIKLLSANGRLVDIPSIAKELSKQIALKNNQYEGLLISNFEVKDDEIKDIEQNLSKKLNADIKLTNKVTDYPGIKVEVESLGIEISFSADRLKTQMAEHILNSL
jgi:F-type H+-transporting ATPase subunit delta